MEAPGYVYVTAGVLSVALIAWLAVAEYLGAANTYFATTNASVPTILFGLLVPMIAAPIVFCCRKTWQASSPRYRCLG